MFAVQKDPIKVIEIKGSDNINNYSELTYSKLETVPVGVPDKYLKWDNNDLLEITAEENAAVDAGISLEQAAQLAEAKKLKTAEVQESAIAWAMAQFPGRRIEGYILNLYTDTLKIQIQQTAVVAFTRLTDIIYPLIDIAESVSEVAAIKYS